MTALTGYRRILGTVTAAFHRLGICGAGIDAVLVQSGVARMTPCQQSPSMKGQVMTFLAKVESAAR